MYVCVYIYTHRGCLVVGLPPPMQNPVSVSNTSNIPI